MSDYEDLAFEPEMTWEDLRQYVIKSAPSMVEKGLCITMKSKDCFYIDSLRFLENGEIFYSGTMCPIVKKRTPAQMKAIIENLFGE